MNSGLSATASMDSNWTLTTSAAFNATTSFTVQVDDGTEAQSNNVSVESYDCTLLVTLPTLEPEYVFQQSG